MHMGLELPDPYLISCLCNASEIWQLKQGGGGTTWQVVFDVGVQHEFRIITSE